MFSRIWHVNCPIGVLFVRAASRETFDPTVDPLVRIEAARLREKLREYYGTDGQDDLIHIDLPKGTYTPQIEFRKPATPDTRLDRPDETTPDRRLDP